MRRVPKYELERGRVEYPEDTAAERPRNRRDCIAGERPCPFVSCQYNLFLDVNEANGSIKLNFPDKEPDELEETCALDVASRGAHTLEVVGDMMNLTRERMRQLETIVVRKLKRRLELLKNDDELQALGWRVA